MITVNGGSARQQYYAFSMAHFVCEKFDINPTVEINFRSMSTDPNFGYCTELEAGEYEIDLKRSLKLRELLCTLAHELVHVKQYEEGTLTQTNEEGMDYWDKPSEIEATGREPGLFIRWAEKNELSHLAWTQV